MFGKQLFQKHPHSPTKVVNGRFEMERDGKTAYLEYNLADNILQLVHTEVPPESRGKGLASELARAALDWARQNNARVDVICPVALGYLEKHPEYNDLLVR
jgi:predicted GNAT family acetyltransferase